MLVNSDFSRVIIVTPDQYRWVASPCDGVERMMLDRLGGEQGRATSIVRYAQEAHFPLHTHPGGEEILVLSGMLREGAREYPAGWYLRNPPGSSHQPSSDIGATIFVKLWQMPSTESRPVRIDTNAPRRWRESKGRSVCPLFSGDAEQVTLQCYAAGERLFANQIDGTELLVLDGAVWSGERFCAQGSWVRLPAGRYPEFVAGHFGATVYMKTGNLAAPASQIC